MKIKLLVAAAAVLLITGCESTKEEVMEKDYVLIVHNVSTLGCSFIGIGVAKREYDLERFTVLYHKDSDNTVDCADYGHIQDKTCWVESLEEGSGYGDNACALGIDEVTTPNTDNEDKVKEKRYVAIIPHLSSLACTTGGINAVLSDHEYYGDQYEFTQETADTTCDTFPDTICQELEGYEEGEAGYSPYISCVIGTDDQPLND